MLCRVDGVDKNLILGNRDWEHRKNSVEKIHKVRESSKYYTPQEHLRPSDRYPQGHFFVCMAKNFLKALSLYLNIMPNKSAHWLFFLRIIIYNSDNS